MGVYRRLIARAGASVALVILLAFAVSGALAQRPGGEGQPGPGQGPCGPEPVVSLLGEFGARLGGNLGVSEEQMRPAMQQTLQQMRPQIEDRARQLCQPGGPGRPAVGGQPFPGAAPAGQGSPFPPELVLGTAVRVLGIEPEQLRQELQQGRSLAEIAQEQGVSPDDLADEITAAAEQLRLQQMHDNIRRFLDQPITPPGPGDRGRP